MYLANYAVISKGTLPAARRLANALSECKIGVCKGTSAASIKCCMGYDHKIAMRLTLKECIAPAL